MNPTKIAAALRLLADAIETPNGAPTAALPAPAPSAETALAAPQPAKPRGRPPGSVNKPAPAAAAEPSASSATASPAKPVAVQASNLTHAIVANDFKAAALAHGRDFVKGLLTAHNAPTFDKVTDLATFQAQLKAGPQAAAAAAATADGTDLLG